MHPAYLVGRLLQVSSQYLLRFTVCIPAALYHASVCNSGYIRLTSVLCQLHCSLGTETYPLFGNTAETLYDKRTPIMRTQSRTAVSSTSLRRPNSMIPNTTLSRDAIFCFRPQVYVAVHVCFIIFSGLAEAELVRFMVQCG